MVSKNTTRVKEVRVFDGNAAAAYGVLLCKPDVIAGVPITPVSACLEQLCQYCADGLLQAELVEAEGELSVIGVVMGASAAGGRTFTATSSQGLAFMYEGYLKVSGSRLPVVMVLATREMAAPDGVLGSQQDFIGVRDGGWIQCVVEGVQEILDSIIMAYRLAEDPEILLPVNVIYDGYYLSHLSERVEVPYQEDVDAFLLPVTNSKRPRLCLEDPLTIPCQPAGNLFHEYRYKHCAAHDKAKQKIDEIDREFQATFGRSYGGLIEEYRTEDADIVLMSMGSCIGAMKDVVDSKREQGEKIGVIKVRFLRPFPRERLAEALRGKKAVGVIDRSVCFGWNCGPLFMESKAAIHDLPAWIPMVGFVAGIGGTDITIEHIERATSITQLAAEGKPHKEVTWLNLE